MSIRTALVIGEDHSLYVQISRLFQQYGCQCKVALNSGLPVDELYSIKPDYILLDLPLRFAPTMQTAKQIGEALQRLQARVMVMAPQVLLFRSDLQFANVRLQKPFSPQQVEAAVMQLLNANRISLSAPTLPNTHIRP